MLAPLILALGGCGGGQPSDALRWSERWEMLAVLEEGGVLDARVWVGNTDLLRGEGHARFDRWVNGETPMLAALDAPPPAVALAEDRSALHLMDRGGIERLEGGEWRFTLSEDLVNASATLRPSAPTPPAASLVVGGGQWSEEALVAGGSLLGWVEAPPRGGLLRGRGVLLHRGGDGWPEGPRSLVILLGDQLSVGVDNQGDWTYAWASWRGEPLDASAARLTPGGVDLRPKAPVWATFKETPLGEHEPEPALLLLERPFAGWLRAPGGRALGRVLAEVHVGESTIRCSGLSLREG